MQTSFDLGDRVASNPRAVIGGNFPPPDDEDEPKEDKSPATPEEARIVFATIEYVKFKCPDLDNFMDKKKGKRKLGWRLLVFNLLKDRGVRQGSIKQLLGYNRKTVGENQQRADVWADLDPEFDDLLGRFRDAVVADSKVDAPATEKRLIHWVKEDPDLQKLEERARLHKLAADEADAAADALAAAKAKKAADALRMAQAKAVKKVLKDHEDREAHAAQQMGAKLLAERLAVEAIAALALLMSNKTGRRHTSEFRTPDDEKNKKPDLALGLERCKLLRLVKLSEPTPPKGVPPPPDPRYSMTEFGQKVADKAVELGRIKKKKRKKVEAEDDDE